MTSAGRDAAPVRDELAEVRGLECQAEALRKLQPAVHVRQRAGDEQLKQGAARDASALQREHAWYQRLAGAAGNTDRPGSPHGRDELGSEARFRAIEGRFRTDGLTAQDVQELQGVTDRPPRRWRRLRDEHENHQTRERELREQLDLRSRLGRSLANALPPL